MAKLLDKKFIGNDQVDGDKLKLLVGQTIRKDDGAGGSVDVIAVLESATAQVQTNSDAEVARAIAEEAAIRGEFAAADAGLQSQITQEISDRQTSFSQLEDSIDAEISDRSAADANLQSQIDTLSGSSGSSLASLEAAITAEETARIAADAVLQSQIDNVLGNVDGAALDSLTEIVSAFQAADASLNGAITALSTGLSADIDAEEAARIAADTALQSEIDAEEVARAAADVTLQNNIDAAAQLGQSQINTLSGQILTLNGNINGEIAARIAGDNALDARVDVLESVTWKKQKFAMSNGQISISLAFTPVAGSVSMFVDQVPMHESVDSGATDDFSISGTSVSFINDFSATGNKKMQNNDTVYVKYQYKA